MSATFTLNVVKLLTTPAIGVMQQVVTKVTWFLTGADSGQTFSLHGESSLNTPDPSKFTPFASLTAEEIASWVSTDPTLVATSAHIQQVLNKMIGDAALAVAPAPWTGTGPVAISPSSPAPVSTANVDAAAGTPAGAVAATIATGAPTAPPTTP